MYATSNDNFPEMEKILSSNIFGIDKKQDIGRYNDLKNNFENQKERLIGLKNTISKIHSQAIRQYHLGNSNLEEFKKIYSQLNEMVNDYLGDGKDKNKLELDELTEIKEEEEETMFNSMKEDDLRALEEMISTLEKHVKSSDDDLTDKLRLLVDGTKDFHSSVYEKKSLSNDNDISVKREMKFPDKEVSPSSTLEKKSPFFTFKNLHSPSSPFQLFSFSKPKTIQQSLSKTNNNFVSGSTRSPLLLIDYKEGEEGIY